MITNKQKQHEISKYAKYVIQCKSKQLVGTAGFTESDRDDLEQEMMLDLIVRMPKFDPNKATINTYVARIIERKICTLIRHRTWEMRDYRCEAFSLNEIIDDEDGESVERGDLVSEESIDPSASARSRGTFDEMAFSHDLDSMLTNLPDHLRKLCEILKWGTITDAAHALGIPRTTLRDHVRKLRSLFEDAGLREYL